MEILHETDFLVSPYQLKQCYLSNCFCHSQFNRSTLHSKVYLTVYVNVKQSKVHACNNYAL